MDKKKVNEEVEVNEVDAAKTQRHQLWSSIIDATINKDEEALGASWRDIVVLKSRDILNPITEREKVEAAAEDEEDEEEPTKKYSHLLKTRAKKKAPLKKMKKSKDDLNEAALREFTSEDSPIRLKGDDVFVNGKLVGRVVNDLTDANSGIVFESDDGKLKKDFDSIKDVYSFLLQHFNVQTETPLDKNDE